MAIGKDDRERNNYDYNYLKLMRQSTAKVDDK